MTCEQLIEFLADYLDRHLPPDTFAHFEHHLADCPSCAVYLSTYEETIRMARHAMITPRLPIGEVPEDLVQAVLAAVRGGRIEN
jgi:anti-sigma factor RsiW